MHARSWNVYFLSRLIREIECYPDDAVYPGYMNSKSRSGYTGGARVSAVERRTLGRVHEISSFEDVLIQPTLQLKSSALLNEV